MKSIRRTLLALAMVMPFTVAVAIPQSAQAEAPPKAAQAEAIPPAALGGDYIEIWTTDPVLSTGRAEFFGGKDREVLKVTDYNLYQYATVGYVWAQQDDGSWDRKMRVRVDDGSAQASHNIDEGRTVRVMVCLEEQGNREVYCNETRGKA